MRYLIVADIHSNLEAFTAVIQAAKREGEVTEIWCLGDIVGYGPDPGACISLLQEYHHICVAGNHDAAALGKIDILDFNPAAAFATRWTAQQLSMEYKLYLDSLPQTKDVGNFTLVHGSPREPIWEYILSPAEAQANLSHFHTNYCLIGHSHLPLFFEFKDDICYVNRLPPLVPLKGSRFILNPGGVGQPRDHDPRASFVIYNTDSNSLRHYRIEYDIATTQDKMIRLGLPKSLSDRLNHGL